MTRFGQTTFTAAAAGLFVLGALAGSARAASPSAGEMDPATDDRSIRPYYNKLDRGAHFAALEQPQLFATEMRAAFNRYGSRMDTTERLVAERAVQRGIV